MQAIQGNRSAVLECCMGVSAEHDERVLDTISAVWLRQCSNMLEESLQEI